MSRIAVPMIGGTVTGTVAEHARCRKCLMSSSLFTVCRDHNPKEFLMKLALCLLAPALATSPLAYAQTDPNMKMPMQGAASAAKGSMVLTDGVVQSVDGASGVVTLKHGEIVNMKMPAMTMSFGVADKTMLEHLKPGDKVKFHVEMLKNAPTVTRIEPAR
jgi:Cu/Ag efflux protein CusF